MLDNFTEGVLKPDLYEPEFNPVYAATLARVVADPARVHDPNRKGSGTDRTHQPRRAATCRQQSIRCLVPTGVGLLNVHGRARLCLVAGYGTAKPWVC